MLVLLAINIKVIIVVLQGMIYRIFNHNLEPLFGFRIKNGFSNIKIPTESNSYRK